MDTGQGRARISRTLLAAALAAALGGCATAGAGLQQAGQALAIGAPPVSDPAADAPDTFADQALPPVAASDTTEGWWSRFADPVLDSLVREALEESISVRQAEARLVEARSTGRATVAGFVPRVVASASTTTETATAGPDLRDINGVVVDEQTTSASAVRASWELPLFGRASSALSGARAGVAGAEADVTSARIAVVGDLAAAYVDLRIAQARVAYLEEDLRRAERLVAIARDRNRVGLISVAEAGQARGQAAQVRGQLPDARIAVRAGLDRIAILRGVMPGSLDERLAPGPAGTLFRADPPEIAAVPADLLRRRPDVRRAEQNALLSAAAVGVARSEIYPSVSITGAISLLAAVSGNPLAESIGRGTVTPAISLPLFDFGQRRAAVTAADARFQQALLGYRATTLGAVAEGQAALTGYSQARERALAAIASERAIQERYRATESAFRAGLFSLQELLEAESALAGARQNRLSAEARASDAAIALYRAFAGAPGI